MIAFVKGEVADLSEGRIVVEAFGMGYEVLVPADVVATVTVGMDVKLHTYFHVREDAMTLFGFLSKEDLEVFKKLINVNSVGPKSALAIMSTLTTESLIMAILSGDAKAISKSPGVGLKSAQKIILELKDKLDSDEILAGVTAEISGEGAGTFITSASLTPAKADAIETLVALGFNKSQATSAVGKVDASDDLDAGEIASLAMKYLR